MNDIGPDLIVFFKSQYTREKIEQVTHLVGKVISKIGSYKLYAKAF